MEEIIVNKCYNCNKIFPTNQAFLRHRNRKTPCLIQNINEKDIKNPNRCIYCNRVYSKKENLVRHHKVCNIKNGGLEILYDKTKYEELLRIVREETERKIEEKDKKIEEMQMKYDKDIVELKSMLTEIIGKKDTVNNNSETNSTINGNVEINNGIVNNNNITIINNLDNPNVDHLFEFERFSKLLAREALRLPVAMLIETFFDPSHPENASVHLLDKETKRVLAMSEGKWIIYAMDKIVDKLRDIGYHLAAEGCRKYGGPDALPEHREVMMKNFEVIKRYKPRKENPDAERADKAEIEQKLFDEYTNSTVHPAVIAEKHRQKIEVSSAKRIAGKK